MRRRRTVRTGLPAQAGTLEGLAYTLWLPAAPPRGGIVILHGAGSSTKESHHDYARAAAAAGFAAIAFDQRGHGASPGPMDDRALADIGMMVAQLRVAAAVPALAVALRGSSMGGYLAIVAAASTGAAAVVAICPASGEGLRRALRAGALGFDADLDALEALLAAHDLDAAVADLAVPVLLLHAEGDEVVPVEHSRELARHLRHPASRLITVPGGHHRSIQHDPELQAVSLRFLARALGPG